MISHGSNGNIVVVIGLEIANKVRSEKASGSTWRPEVMSDPDKKGAVLLRTIGVQDADVMRQSQLILT